MRIAVTGANGFLGRHLIARLATTDQEVVAVGREKATLRGLFGQEVDAYETDYSTKGLAQVFGGVDTVLHLASARVNRQTDLCMLTQFYESILRLSENVLMAAVDAEVKRICLVSSQSVYSSRNTLPFRESEAAQPSNAYGVAKLACEKLALVVGESRGLEVLNLRLARLYGLGDRPDLMMPTFIELAKRRETLRVTGPGQKIIDQIYVKDAVAALESAATGAVQRGTFNIGSGRAHSVKEYAETVNAVFGNEGNIVFDARPEDPRQDIEMDSTLAREVLGWVPKWTLAEALEEMRDLESRA